MDKDEVGNTQILVELCGVKTRHLLTDSGNGHAIGRLGSYDAGLRGAKTQSNYHTKQGSGRGGRTGITEISTGIFQPRYVQLRLRLRGADRLQE